MTEIILNTNNIQDIKNMAADIKKLVKDFDEDVYMKKKTEKSYLFIN